MRDRSEARSLSCTSIDKSKLHKIRDNILSLQDLVDSEEWKGRELSPLVSHSPFLLK
jgi:hypothetical protein